jgi:L,D-transpeptidase YcbB
MVCVRLPGARAKLRVDMSPVRASLALAAALAVAAPAAAAADRVAAALAARLAQPVLTIDGEPLDAAVLRRLYAARRGAPLWTREGGGRGAALAAVLADAATEGLDPRDYHLGPIGRRLGARRPDDVALRDLVLSDAALAYVAHLESGRPVGELPQVMLARHAVDPVPLVLAAAKTADVRAYLASLAPPQPAYRGLREALARSRELARAGPWTALVLPARLDPGDAAPGVPGLRARLAATGDLPDATPAGAADTYDPALAAAVRVYQARHGLEPDAVVGRRTRAALDVGPSARAAQIALNMERWRWMPRDLGRRYVLVNVAGFRLELVEDGERTMELPVVVGRESWETPTFASRITRVIFNPSWRIPDSILREEVLPKVGRDPGWLAREGIVVHDLRLLGAPEIDPRAVDWRQPRGGLRLRQEPGPRNPLGRVKIDMPNPFDVYLHDTAYPELFGRPVRAFSHGCVRVGSALALASQLLRDAPGWSPEDEAEVLDGWETRVVRPRRPVPVYVIYETAWRASDGQVELRSDVYGRDADLAAAIAAWRQKRRGARGPGG